MENHMENRYLSGFNIKGNGGAYKVCTAPNMICSENYFKHVLQLYRGSKTFGTSTFKKMSMCRMPHGVHVISYTLTKKKLI